MTDEEKWRLVWSEHERKLADGWKPPRRTIPSKRVCEPQLDLTALNREHDRKLATNPYFRLVVDALR